MSSIPIDSPSLPPLPSSSSPPPSIPTSQVGNPVPSSPNDDQATPPPAKYHDDSLCCSSKGRNLVACVDGTAKQFGEKNTNVVELYSRLVRDEEGQLTYYNSGIGTYAKSSVRSLRYILQVLGHTIDMAFAIRLKKIIFATYEWLSENYKPGDRIFLFGFSRGAYQVRILAAMIHQVGLLHKGNKSQIPFAYARYASVRTADKTESEKAIRLCSQFKKALCHSDVEVHFVGAWDTVSSIGLGGTTLPETTEGMKHVCVFRHALALDERRVQFLPEYANGGRGPGQASKRDAEDVKEVIKEDPKDVSKIARKKKGNVKEVWFAGSHSDIGGGNIPNESLENFGPALRWMTYEAMKEGLQMHPYQGKWAPLKPTKSYTLMWLPFELLPFRHRSYLEGRHSTYIPHFAHPRVIQPGQLIHQSVTDLLQQQTTANNHACSISPNHEAIVDISGDADTTTKSSYGILDPLLDPLFRSRDHYRTSSRLELTEYKTWASLLRDIPTSESSKASYPGVIERDPFVSASHNLQLLRAECDKLSKAQMVATGDFSSFYASIEALRSLIEHDSETTPVREVSGAATTLLLALKLDYQHCKNTSTQSNACITLMRLLSSFPPMPHLKRQYVMSEVRKWMSSGGKPMIDKVLKNFGNRILQSQDVHTSIKCARFSTAPGTSILISTRSQHMVWDPPTTNTVPTTIHDYVNRPFFYHWVSNAEAISEDGSRIAYGCRDCTLAIFNTTTREITVVQNLDDSPIWAACFSHNLTMLASGSRNGLVTLHKDPTYLESSRLDGHVGEVNALAFSSDDRLLASACDDCTVCIWDVAKAEKKTVLRGHDDMVMSISWSPSGDRIASGSANGRIIISELNSNILYNFRSHLGLPISTLAYSPDGDTLVTGGGDHQIQGWSQTGSQLWHYSVDSGITSVAFSADGRYLVTGEFGGNVRIWDMDTRLLTDESE